MILETQKKSSSYDFGWNLARAIALPHDYRRKLHGLTSVVQLKMKVLLGIALNPVDTGRKLNVHKTFRRLPARLLNVSCTFNLRPVSTGEVPERVANIGNRYKCTDKRKRCVKYTRIIAEVREKKIISKWPKNNASHSLKVFVEHNL